MSKSIAESTYITLSVKSFIDVALGRSYWHDRPLPPDVGEILLLITRNSPEFGCFIQTRDEFNQPLSEPVLWKYSAWSDSHERYVRQKKRSEEERVKRFIFEANVNTVAKRIAAVLGVTGDAGRMTAIQLVRANKQGTLRFLGVNKLITKEEELT